MSELTSKEQDILKSYFTNLNQDVFVLVNLPEVVKGALFSRYSRSPKSLRRLLLEEFILDEESGFGEMTGNTLLLGEAEGPSLEGNIIATQKAEEFYDRVLVGYGDDSVAELAGVHLAVENVSQMIGAKALEDSRIGMSYLEKSTRYVRYDDKVGGKYRYLREPKIMASKWAGLYEQTNDRLFDTYAELVDKMMQWVRQRYPQESGVKDGVYNATVRAKACDVCRQLLPLSTLTNVGLFGNGRAFEYLIIKMMVSPFAEVREIATQMKMELDKVIPSFVKRATNERGEVWQDYIKNQKLNIKNTYEKLSISKQGRNRTVDMKDGVRLVSYEKEGEDKVLVGMLYALDDQDFEQMLQQVKRLSEKDRERLTAAYCDGRKNRHHKLGRALEMTDYVFEVVASIGCYKDLQRHRILTPLVQSYHPYFGYEVPVEIVEAGYEKRYWEAMDMAADAFEKIADTEGEIHELSLQNEAQYVLPLGYRMRWLMKVNLREVCHLTELRSTKQGHPHYRVVAQQMADEVRKVHPMLAKWATQFVDYEKVELERLEGEKRTAKKLEDLKHK